MTDTYGPGIVVPVGNSSISASQYGVPMRNAVIALDARLQIIEREQTLAYVSDPNNSAAIGTTETVIMQTGTLLLPNGYAFEADFGWGVQGSAAGGRADFFFHETNAGGTTLGGGSGTIDLTASGINYGVNGRAVFVNTSGADLSKVIALTLQESGAAGTATHVGTSTRPRWFRVKLVDVADNYPGAISLT